jgi:hypothetical protein
MTGPPPDRPYTLPSLLPLRPVSVFLQVHHVCSRQSYHFFIFFAPQDAE